MRLLLILSVVSSLGAACGDDGSVAPEDGGGPDAPPVSDAGSPDAGSPPDAGRDLPPGAARACAGRELDRRGPVRLGELSGEYVGVLSGPAEGVPFPERSTMSMKVVPEHAFEVHAIRVAFGAGTGVARLRVVESFGRTYPASYLDPDGDHDVVPPVDVEVLDADPERWIEIDVSAAGAVLEPTRHYHVVYEHLGPEPLLALESVPEGEHSRALLFVPPQPDAFGVPGQFRMQLVGEHLCAWADGERLFERAEGLPFDDLRSPYLQLADLDGDLVDDLVLHDEGVRVFTGDGDGGFAAAAPELLGAMQTHGLTIFADVDGDGDQDAFAARSLTPDRDGDRFTYAMGDCDDTDPAVRPGRAEVPDNGRDDDCDGVADDGTSDADADEDGFSIAAGDCDDTNPDVFPGAEEIVDGLDDDCDGATEEGFTHRLFLNDGEGRFEALEGSGVEAQSGATAGAFGDADGDGVLDLYVGNWLHHYPDFDAEADLFFRGLGGGRFEERLEAAGMGLRVNRPVYGVAWTDFDGDGHQDVFVGNYNLRRNQLYRNRGDGTFEDVAEAVGADADDVFGPAVQYPGGHTYGGDFGDVDNDGDMDMYMCNLAHPRVQPWSDPSMFLVSRGAPGFVFDERREALGVEYDEGDVNAHFGDFDGDMDLDLVIASLYTGHFARLYRNDGEAGFVDVTYEAGVAVHDAVGAIFADVDRDGDLDLFVTDRDGQAPSVHLFLNRGHPGRGSVSLLLEGTTTNRDALGARVTLVAGGVTQIRDVRTSQGHQNNQRPRAVHFGLGDATEIESLSVRWVGGATETFAGVTPDGRFHLVEGTGAAIPL